MPFMLETMLRSGVPPHMGQSPPAFGSEAQTKNKGMATSAPAISCFRIEFAVTFRLSKEHAKGSIAEQAGAALAVRNRIDTVD